MSVSAAYAAKKPNILVIWGDDIGNDNVSAYHRGMMGGSTPNIDRIANEGALMTTGARLQPEPRQDHGQDSVRKTGSVICIMDRITWATSATK